MDPQKQYISNILKKKKIENLVIKFEGGKIEEEDFNQYGMLGARSFEVNGSLKEFTEEENNTIQGYVEELLDSNYKGWDSGIGHTGTFGTVEFKRTNKYKSIICKVTMNYIQQITTTNAF